jgi:hypothetical protein
LSKFVSDGSGTRHPGRYKVGNRHAIGVDGEAYAGHRRALCVEHRYGNRAQAIGVLAI